MIRDCKIYTSLYDSNLTISREWSENFWVGVEDTSNQDSSSILTAPLTTALKKLLLSHSTGRICSAQMEGQVYCVEDVSQDVAWH